MSLAMLYCKWVPFKLPPSFYTFQLTLPSADCHSLLIEYNLKKKKKEKKSKKVHQATIMDLLLPNLCCAWHKL